MVSIPSIVINPAMQVAARMPDYSSKGAGRLEGQDSKRDAQLCSRWLRTKASLMLAPVLTVQHK